MTGGLAGGNPDGAISSASNQSIKGMSQNLNGNTFMSQSNSSSDVILPDAPPPTINSNIVQTVQKLEQITNDQNSILNLLKHS